MEKKELTEWIKGLGEVTADCPFEEDFETQVFRHAKTRRWFGLWLKVPKKYFGGAEDEFCLNLKCPPQLSEILRQNYKGILPAYHMNKASWITAALDGSIPDDKLKMLLELSFEATAPGRRGRKADKEQER